MKFIKCDLCGSFDSIPLYFDAVKFCHCSNIGGRYLFDSISALIICKNEDTKKTARVIGVPNDVMEGKAESGKCGIGSWEDDKQLLLLVNGKLQHNDLERFFTNKTEPHIHTLNVLFVMLKNMKMELDDEACKFLLRVEDAVKKAKDIVEKAIEVLPKETNDSPKKPWWKGWIYPIK